MLMPTRKKKFPVHVQQRDGNVFSWILRTAQELRDQQHAERIEAGRRPLLPRRR